MTVSLDLYIDNYKNKDMAQYIRSKPMMLLGPGVASVTIP